MGTSPEDPKDSPKPVRPSMPRGCGTGRGEGAGPDLLTRKKEEGGDHKRFCKGKITGTGLRPGRILFFIKLKGTAGLDKRGFHVEFGGDQPCQRRDPIAFGCIMPACIEIESLFLCQVEMFLA